MSEYGLVIKDASGVVKFDRSARLSHIIRVVDTTTTTQTVVSIPEMADELDIAIVVVNKSKNGAIYSVQKTAATEITITPDTFCGNDLQASIYILGY